MLFNFKGGKCLGVSSKIKKVTIIGLGLIGGSWGMALKRTRPEINICGVDIDSNTIQIGIETKCIDWGTLDIRQGVKDADLVVISTLVSSITKIAEEIAPYLKPGCIVTDVGSTKEEITGIVNDLLPITIHYVPGHPMAGSEAKGIIGADAYLFENAVYILTPVLTTNDHALLIIKELIESMGARVLNLSPYEHDLKVAAISHLPHVVAAALVNAVSLLEEEQGEIFKLSAGGFRDLTRIAGSQPEMWRDIFLQNRQGVLQSLSFFRQALDKIEKAIRQEDMEDIYEFLMKAKNERSKIPIKVKGILPEVYEIVVTVPDKPGIIGAIANLLGKEEINIIDIEILRVREGDGGTIRFGFQKADLRDRAVEILRNHGFIAKVRN